MSEQYSYIDPDNFNNLIHKYIQRFPDCFHSTINSNDFQLQMYTILKSFDSSVPEDVIFLMIEYSGIACQWVDAGESTCTMTSVVLVPRTFFGNRIRGGPISSYAYNSYKDEYCFKLDFCTTMNCYQVDNDDLDDSDRCIELDDSLDQYGQLCCFDNDNNYYYGLHNIMKMSGQNHTIIWKTILSGSGICTGTL